jgi:hypothetical protein
VVRRFDEVCKLCHENDKKVMVDAEETWMQDAADHLCEEMMEKYNQENLLFGIPSRCTEPEDWNIWKKTFREQRKRLFYWI